MAHPAHYKEAHPMPFVLTHWINLIAIVALAFSGFYIHYPFFRGFMGVARGMHFFFMYVLIVNLIVRLIMAFFVKSAIVNGSRTAVDTDVKNFLPQKANRHQLWPWIKYYLFLKKDHPLGAKYGVLQKIAYIATVPLTFFMAWTGFSIYGPYMDNAFFQSSLQWVGGPMNMRIIHYFTMWVFLIFTAIHAYLANVEGFAPSRIMFAWKESEGLHFDADGNIIGGESH